MGGFLTCLGSRMSWQCACSKQWGVHSTHTHTLTPHFPPPPPPTPIVILKLHAFLEEINIHYIGMYVRSCCAVPALLQRQHRGTRFLPNHLCFCFLHGWVPQSKMPPHLTASIRRHLYFCFSSTTHYALHILLYVHDEQYMYLYELFQRLFVYRI